MIRFTLADLERASATWGCNCGPASLAAICGLTLDEARPHFPGFRGWTNPTMMGGALDSVRRATGRTWSTIGVGRRDRLTWPIYGLARIQWEGSWCAPGVNPRAAYRYTHWVGVASHADGVDIWDVNTLGIQTPLGPSNGWDPLGDWERIIASRLAADIKRATGGWHVTHAIEVER